MQTLPSGRSPLGIAVMLMAAGGFVMVFSYRNFKRPTSFTPESKWYRWIYYRYYYDEEDEFIHISEEGIKRYMKRAFLSGLLVFLNGLIILLLMVFQQ